jgi:hypothetical protein
MIQHVTLESNSWKERTCVYRYVMDGLSPAELRVFLQIESPEESISTNVSDDNVLWQAEYHTQGEWVATQFLYTCEVPHKASQEPNHLLECKLPY